MVTLRQHWPEYVMEAAELAAFMISAAIFSALLYYPASPVAAAIGGDFARRAIIGLLMGATAVCLVRSPWGRRSGAHMNPALTLTFLRLGKIAATDAAFYVVAQFAGAIAGIAVAAAIIGPALGSPQVNYVATQPGDLGTAMAFAAEMTISFVLMLTVLLVSNTSRLAAYTPYFVGVLVASYIAFEAPLSGMSMNPARTFGPALLGDVWNAVWVYFTAPPLGMLAAAETYRYAAGRRGLSPVWCAKLYHDRHSRCIFHCAHPSA